MNEAYETVSKQYSESKARELFIENPRFILADQII